jgi:hypothetical protein
MQAIKEIFRTLGQVMRLPRMEVSLGARSPESLQVYRSFNRRHPRYLVIRNKTVGVALLDIRNFLTEDDYTRTIRGKNSADYFSRKALRLGYTFKPFDPEQYRDDIYQINTSLSYRQGRPMEGSYLDRGALTAPGQCFRHFAVFGGNRPVAYLYAMLLGETCIISRLLGHRDHLQDGVMYLLVTRTVHEMIRNQKEVGFIMYDTFFGASAGLKLFKKRLGFVPYRVRWYLP